MTNFKSDVTRKQSTPNFPKKKHFLSPWYELFVFWKIWRALFSCNTRFEIHPFGFLPKFDVWQGSDRFLHWLEIRFPATLHQHNIKKLWPLRHIINKAFSTYAYVKLFYKPTTTQCQLMSHELGHRTQKGWISSIEKRNTKF